MAASHFVVVVVVVICKRDLSDRVRFAFVFFYSRGNLFWLLFLSFDYLLLFNFYTIVSTSLSITYTQIAYTREKKDINKILRQPVNQRSCEYLLLLLVDLCELFFFGVYAFDFSFKCKFLQTVVATSFFFIFDVFS